MNHLGISVIVQLSLALGVAGVLWPEKLMPLFELLLFPFPSSYRNVRANSIGAIVLSILLFFSLLARSA
ncbi:MAG: hypothetical protein M3O09_02990 [Acidobacteriota bacterium]|nr:hypothetical protein [Acidobacteriota bacterium]